MKPLRPFSVSIARILCQGNQIDTNEWRNSRFKDEDGPGPYPDITPIFDQILKQVFQTLELLAVQIISSEKQVQIETDRLNSLKTQLRQIPAILPPSKASNVPLPSDAPAHQTWGDLGEQDDQERVQDQGGQHREMDDQSVISVSNFSTSTSQSGMNNIPEHLRKVVKTRADLQRRLDVLAIQKQANDMLATGTSADDVKQEISSLRQTVQSLCRDLEKSIGSLGDSSFVEALVKSQAPAGPGERPMAAGSSPAYDSGHARDVLRQSVHASREAYVRELDTLIQSNTEQRELLLQHMVDLPSLNILIVRSILNHITEERVKFYAFLLATSPGKPKNTANSNSTENQFLRLVEQYHNVWDQAGTTTGSAARSRIFKTLSDNGVVHNDLDIALGASNAGPYFFSLSFVQTVQNLTPFNPNSVVLTVADNTQVTFGKLIVHELRMNEIEIFNDNLDDLSVPGRLQTSPQPSARLVTIADVS